MTARSMWWQARSHGPAVPLGQKASCQARAVCFKLETTMRPSGRTQDAMRAVTLETGFSKYAEGSCLAKFGDTHVLCTATIEERVPPWMRHSGKGWVTAEHGMV